jgi:hypothetical protein
VSLALGLCCSLQTPSVADAPTPSLETSSSHFRVRDPDRDRMLGVGPTLGGKLYTIGSPNPAQWAPELGARFVFGSWRYSLLVRGAVAPIVPLRKSIANTQRGAMVEGVVALRIMPVQHRLVRFGGWVGIAFDEIRVRVELDEQAGGANGRKRAGHISPELGFELAFPLVFPRADRPWSLDILLAHEVRLALATRSTLRFEDETGEHVQHHRAAELTVVGPFSGLIIGGRVGLAFQYDFVTARSSRAGQ